MAPASETKYVNARSFRPYHYAMSSQAPRYLAKVVYTRCHNSGRRARHHGESGVRMAQQSRSGPPSEPARKWRRLAALERRRPSWGCSPGFIETGDANGTTTSAIDGIGGINEGLRGQQLPESASDLTTHGRRGRFEPTRPRRGRWACRRTGCLTCRAPRRGRRGPAQG